MARYRRRKISGLLIGSGLIVEAISLVDLYNPTMFLLFSILGITLVVAGVGLYLWALATRPADT